MALTGLRRTVTRIARGVETRLRPYLPSARRIARENDLMRRDGLALLADFAADGTPPRLGRILVDGMWDNANYWLRYGLLSRALGLAAAEKTGILGRHNRERVAAAFAAFGFAHVRDMAADGGPHPRRRAETLRSTLRTPDDVLRLELPAELPSVLLYDGLLKRQRRGEVDLSDPMLTAMIEECLRAIENAEAILDEGRWDAIVLSHAVDFTYGALANAALRRGIPCFVLFADFGSLRFARLATREDLFRYIFSPSREEMDTLTPERERGLRDAGRAYLAARLGGRSIDVGAIYAYQRARDAVTRDSLCNRFGWDPGKPIVGFYAPNWFDYPHACAGLPFRDFLDLADCVIAGAAGQDRVNYLFKGHPCDAWYGDIRGPTLAERVAQRGDRRCGMADPAWSGRDLLGSIDAVITAHGTIGIEAPAIGKPALLPYAGWYGHLGFARAAGDRREFEALLARRWWDGIDRDDTKRRAEIFAGWYFCVPAEDAAYVFADDANMDAIWWDLRDFLARHREAIARDVEMVRSWFTAGDRHFHLTKMRAHGGFVPPLPPQTGDGIDPRRRQLRGKPR